MQITQIRNATIMINIGDYRILVDPMLARKSTIPALKYVTRARRRNPLVELPEAADSLLSTVSHSLITHCQKGHFDHLDRAGAKFLRDHNVPVFCMPDDRQFLATKGLATRVLIDGTQPFLDGKLTPIPCVHGEGIVGRMMAHGHGYFIEFPGEPSLYLAGDTILTGEIADFILRKQPDICLVPAGGAQFDIGGEIIMGLTDVEELAGISTGKIIANHLEALDHCPVTRLQLKNLRERKGLEQRLYIPDDGETLVFEC
ncbi:Zn-dependent hydrolase [Aliidiomarina minuta]|uniref:Zn-dependent hydrolase n=2 Tax=Aliidiomarina minuta TaxID=880057 RepID=A0A432WAD8_9GAMM|nr:Zn-dependent hydrolase [Aliidiomarina minuta]